MSEQKKNTPVLTKIQNDLIVEKKRIVYKKPYVDKKTGRTVYNHEQYRYRNIEDIFEVLKPLLKKYCASVYITDHAPILVGNYIYIQATAVFQAPGEEPVYNVGVAREDLHGQFMSPSQQTGSASTYARKYALGGLFLLDDNQDADQLDEQENKNASQPVQASKLATSEQVQKIKDLAAKRDSNEKREPGTSFKMLLASYQITDLNKITSTKAYEIIRTAEQVIN